MTLQIFPTTKTWSRTSSVLVVAIVLLPTLAMGLARSNDHTLRHIARVDALIVAPAILIAAIGFYAGWRLTATRALAWTTFGVASLGFEALAIVGIEMLRGVTPADPWSQVADASGVATVAVCAYLSRRRVFPTDPIAAGVLLGAALALVRLLVHELVDLGSTGLAVSASATIMLDVVVCVLLLTQRRKQWQLVQISLTIVLLSVAYLLSRATQSPLASAVVISADVLGAAVMLSAALTTLRTATGRARAEREALQLRLDVAEAGARVERARMHELNSTIAGITSASRLIHNVRITEQRRHLLEDMMQSELARLERLMSNGPGLVTPPMSGSESAAPSGINHLGKVDLDYVMSTLHLSQQARGRDVHWSPADCWARGDVDAVTEILQILLDNGALHGGSPVEVSIAQVGYAIEICVSDSGPGIAPELRERLFDWGVRGSSSRGQGIGLHIARKLAEQQAGYLTLRDVPGQRGATFVLWLPAAERSEIFDDFDDHDTARRLA